MLRLLRGEKPMRTVLLVDDSAVARRVLARRLEAEGFLVCEASSMATARKVDCASLGCAIVDLELADGDGTDLARNLLEKRPALPIAFFTMGTAPSLVEGARARGPVFLKPTSTRPCVGPADHPTESTSSDEVNDLDLVAGRHAVLRVARARDDGPVDLDRDGAVPEAKVLDQLSNADVLGHLSSRAVDGDLHPGSLPSRP